MTKGVTTIRVSTDLRDELKKLGTKGETYDEIIKRILKIAATNTGGKS